MQAKDLLSDIGGQMGLLIGLSVVAMFDIILFILDVSTLHLRKKLNFCRFHCFDLWMYRTFLSFCRRNEHRRNSIEPADNDVELSKYSSQIYDSPTIA